MRARVEFDTYGVVIEFEPFMGEDISKYQEEFEKYFYVEIEENFKGKKATGYIPKKMCWGIQEIFDWMKEMSPLSNPRVISTYKRGEKYDKTLPEMSF